MRSVVVVVGGLYSRSSSLLQCCAAARRPPLAKASIVEPFVSMSSGPNCLPQRRSIAARKVAGLSVGRFNWARASTEISVENDPDVSESPSIEWDPLGEFFGIGSDIELRNLAVRSPEPRSWYGPDGQLIRELPCPSCRGRGYIICPQCKVGSPEACCLDCHGKGLRTCLECLGERVVKEESLDEMLWEKAQSCSPLQVEDDEAIDSMEIQLAPEKKSKRVYGSPSQEVREKIRQALKKLNAQTGSISRRMRHNLSDPIINAKRIAAIKEAKRTDEARRAISEKLRLYFQKPENRLKRSLSLRGAEFRCSLCKEKGHRRRSCPSLPKPVRRKETSRPYHCSLCGQLGHSRTTCLNNSNVKKELTKCHEKGFEKQSMKI